MLLKIVQTVQYADRSSRSAVN